MRFRLIQAHRQEFRLDVPCAGRHEEWILRPREIHDTVLTAEIEQIHATSKGRYGVPRIHAELREQGWPCSRRRGARHQASAGLKGKDRKKDKGTTNSNHAHPLADD
ncbi:IS3 family transposase [Deinococcus oregonensis]|uniref:IS3 family transposase n=1 Tax=Deinococcus oregonensis TaxID=1805970 RepID=A0ABV6B228_9DEIO